MAIQVFGDSISGNCLKVKWVCDVLNIPCRWEEVDILNGESRVPAFLAMNPAGQVPVVILEDGRALAQSNAIAMYLAEGSRLIPADRYGRAKVSEWLFWEQYRHEPYIAVARFQVVYQHRTFAELEPKLVERGHAALSRLEAATGESAFLVGEALSLADIALVAYTRMAGQGGFDLNAYPAVRSWIGRVEGELRLDPLV